MNGWPPKLKTFCLLAVFFIAPAINCGPLHADAMSDAAAKGRTAAEALLLKPGSSVFTQETIDTVVTPFTTESPPETAITGSSIEGDTQAKAAGSTIEATTLKTEVGASSLNPRPNIDQHDPAITTADQIDQTSVARAGALFSATGSLDTTCTVTGLGTAGTIERSCERVVSVDTFHCQQTLQVSVTRRDTYECDVKYLSTGVITDECAALKQAPTCQQTASSCLNLGADGQCVSERRDYACLNEDGDMTPARKTSTSAPDFEESVAETCDPAATASTCEADGRTCTSGPETRMINGVPITRACWAWDKPVVCQVPGLNTDCTVFANDPSCKRIQTNCLSETADGTCVDWEDRYRCSGTAQPGTQSCENMTVCAGGYCETVVPEPANTDFGKSATWLGVLDEMAKDSEKDLSNQELRVFNGQRATCRVGALNVLNCCNDTGWGNHILGQCTDSEYALMDRTAALATHFVGTYCSKRFFVCLQKKRVYCSFNSKLARVFIEQYHNLSGVSWDDPKYETHCEGLTAEQMQTLDMDQFDLSEAFADFVNDAAIPSAEMIKNFLETRVGN
jgi:Type-1V conjugative transfer system mating pair stabilisation